MYIFTCFFQTESEIDCCVFFTKDLCLRHIKDQNSSGYLVTKIISSEYQFDADAIDQKILFDKIKEIEYTVDEFKEWCFLDDLRK